jgi:hypothetical protein
MLLPGQYQRKGGLVNAAGVADAEMALHLPPKVLKNELVHHSHIRSPTAMQVDIVA